MQKKRIPSLLRTCREPRLAPTSDFTMNTGIPQLFMDTRVGTSDDWSFNNYGYHRPQPYPHIPLSLELVMNGQSFRSTAPLFQFPLEVLTLIVEQVPSQCLKSLALVNSDVSNSLSFFSYSRLTNSSLSYSVDNLHALASSPISILVATNLDGLCSRFYTKNIKNISTNSPPRIRLIPWSTVAIL